MIKTFHASKQQERVHRWPRPGSRSAVDCPGSARLHAKQRSPSAVKRRTAEVKENMGLYFTGCTEDLHFRLCTMSPQRGPGQEASVPLGGNLLIFLLAALANPSAKRAEAPVPCQQSHQAQMSPTATSPLDGARTRACPAVCMLLSSSVHQHLQRTPVPLQGAWEGWEVPSREDAEGLAQQRVLLGCCSQAQTNGQCRITCTLPRVTAPRHRSQSGSCPRGKLDWMRQFVHDRSVLAVPRLLVYC